MGKNKFNNKFSNLESKENTQKYVKEMYDLAEKHEKRSIMSFLVIGVPIGFILIFTLVQMISFSVHSTKNNTKQTVYNIHSNSISSNVKKNANAVKHQLIKVKTSALKPVDVNLTPANEINAKIFDYLKIVANRNISYNKAKQLNNSKDKGLSSIYIAQILRDTGYKIDNSIINASSLVNALKKDGWKPISDYKQLRKGDICFSASSSSNGAPSHVYIFITWVKKGNTNYAWVIDNQVSEHKNVYHKRNIDFTTPTKEKFSFCMRKQ